MFPDNINPTAAIIIIGNEILSGRTLDSNTRYIAQKLRLSGIVLVEVRIISDTIEQIIEVVNSLRAKYKYVFTTGGIGPTHDDVTSKAISLAFNAPLELNIQAYNLLNSYYTTLNIEMNDARKKMAYLPIGSKLIQNSISAAPGFNLENVFVLAGIPSIMEVMLEEVLSNIKIGKAIKSQSVDVILGEGAIAQELERLQLKFPNIEMGSYPFKIDQSHATSIVLSSDDYEMLDLAFKELCELFNTHKV